jgi:hypothetical protein
MSKKINKMDTKKILPFIFITIAVIAAIMWYFRRSEQREKAMNAQIELQLADYNQLRIKECRTKAIARAGFLVDSILLVNAKSIQTDTTSFLLKPLKPTKPTILTADSLGVVAPLFKKYE